MWLSIQGISVEAGPLRRSGHCHTNHSLPTCLPSYLQPVQELAVADTFLLLLSLSAAFVEPSKKEDKYKTRITWLCLSLALLAYSWPLCLPPYQSQWTSRAFINTIQTPPTQVQEKSSHVLLRAIMSVDVNVKIFNCC